MLKSVAFYISIGMDMAVDCLGRDMKVGDWVSYTNTWQAADVRVGKISIIKDKRKDGKPRVHAEITISGTEGYCTSVNRSGYICLMEAPFDKLKGALGVGDKYKM